MTTHTLNNTQETLQDYLPILREIESRFDKLIDDAETDEEEALAREAWERAASFVALAEISAN